MLYIIVAYARNRVIGAKNDLPWYLPSDLKRFKALTTGHTVVMGRKTFESILTRRGSPLPNRHNVVVSRQPDFHYEGVEVLHDSARIADLAGDVFIIGGAELYATTLPLVTTLFVTEVHADISGDTFFPVIQPHEWRESSREPHKADDTHGYAFDFVTYERVL